MADNATALEEGPFDSLNATNLTATVPGSYPPNHFFSLDFILLEFRLVGSAIGIIYLGAHAALRRPPSAARRQPKSGSKHKDADEDTFTEGLLPSDAITFPLLAAAMLIGLYYLIQYLKDPEILNKILRWYMLAVSGASLLTFYAHGLELGASFLLPSYWRGRDGRLRKVEQKTKSVIICDDVGNSQEGLPTESNPLPGLLAWIAPTERAKDLAWRIRKALTQYAHLKLYARGIGMESLQVNSSHLCAVALSAATVIIYFSTTSTILSNVLGHAMCYGSFVLLSPTDLMTGTLVLMALFFYDIIMVFYTPYMITVATTLDVPIKLQFEAASRKSMLGLGDIVIPGMVMAWALRLDLWLYYQGRIKYESTPLSLIEKDADGSIVKKSQVMHKEVKAPYMNAKGSWGERFWTRGSLFLAVPSVSPPALRATNFPKRYFTASAVGYLLGMAVTLAMMIIFEHGQPALLYLVPGVLGSLYITALVRGELSRIWAYTEDGSLDKVDMVVELDSEGRVVQAVGELENGIVDTTKNDPNAEKKDNKTQQDKGESAQKLDESASETEVIEKQDHSTAHGGRLRLISITLDLPSDDES